MGSCGNKPENGRVIWGHDTKMDLIRYGKTNNSRSHSPYVYWADSFSVCHHRSPQDFDGYAVDFSRSAIKTNTPLIETPQIVDVVTRQQIEDQGARSVNEALAYTPGVFTGLAGASSRQAAVAIRGFRQPHD